MASAAVQAQLTAAFTASRSSATSFPGYAAIPPAAVGGIVPGSLYYAYVPPSGSFWALASFQPAPGASGSLLIGFQDGGATAVFTRTTSGAWTVSYVGVCNGGRIPPAVLAVWSLTPQPFPGGTGCTSVDLRS